MKIIKKSGESQVFNPNKVLTRIKSNSKGLKVDIDHIFKLVIPEINDGISTTEIDELLAYKIADLIQEHPDYSTLASRILISRQAKLIGVEPEEIDNNFDFFGTVTFLKKYSKRDENKKPTELPSMMYNRVAEFFGQSEEEINLFKTELKNRKISAATPILTNADTKRKAYISCNITTLIDDSLEGIEQTMTNLASASKEGAGVGILIDALRSKESMVSSFDDKAGGIVRLADKIQAQMRFYRQGTRSGSAALYLSLWHRDILDFLALRLPIGDEKLRTRDLFTAVVVNDLFMDALINDKDWYTFCPNDIKKAGLRPLQDLHNEEFEKEYNKAVELGIGHKINPKTIYDAIIRSQAEAGTPYVFYKDAANRKNMQDNIGTIKSLNLCIEFTGVSDANYTSQCDLGLIPLAYHDSLESIAESVRVLVRLLNRVIDKNEWSDTSSTKAGNDQRAIGIGIGGLADFFAKKKIAFTSDEAKEWNKNIMKTIYEAAQDESSKLAIERGYNYPAYAGSKYERGETYLGKISDKPIPMLNSILVCLMPSASTSILLGINECFEPFSSNIGVRNSGAGEFIVINKWLVNDLEELGLWNEQNRRSIIQSNGSAQYLDAPQEIKDRYLTVWEIPQKEMINMAADRQDYIDQSQSMNLYFPKGEYGKISGAMKYGWEKGLKTGVYYTRTQSKLEAPKHMAESSNLPSKPADSQFECFGCSS